jgi:cbb3-type cytochrome oxidase subunit 3
MTLGQQWAIVFAIFWIASICYAYKLGKLHGEAKGIQWSIDRS